MAKNLVIVESPAKAKTINRILGAEYEVRASMGHVRDLPEKKLGVNIEGGFAPEYVTIKGRQKVVKELRAAAKTAERIFLAPDPDREGEAIAWHLWTILSGLAEDDKFFRVTYNEITPSAIRAAFAHPNRIDMHLVDAQQARRVLDRIVGYQVSPLLWRRIRGSRSAGRVQSVALRLVCEREREIRAFVPEEYWVVGARVRKQVDPRDPFEVRLARINADKAELRNADEVSAVEADLAGRSLAVERIVDREVTRRPPPPFITSTLQQAASSACGYAPSRTMRVAQRLYEGMDFGQGPVGLITYMRTDSVAVAQSAREACRNFVAETFGQDYLPDQPNVYKSRGSAQEAHEAIRPTEPARTPEQLASVLKSEELKLYRLIWTRFVASQMAPARIAQRTYEIEARPDPAAGGAAARYLFRASTSVVRFPGYLKVAGKESSNGANGDGPDETAVVPELREGETLECLEWLKEQKFTQPPPRFTEASLVRALEENGVGRPSTYAQILSTIITRSYVDREKRALVPSELGMKVNEFLVAHLGELFDVGFTARMEELLDDIERGEVEWSGMLADFYGKFQGWVEQAVGPAADGNAVRTLLDLLSAVQEWAEPVKRGKRTYSDEAFVASVCKQLEEGKKAISGRQVDALVGLIAKYRGQFETDPAEILEGLGLGEAYRTAAAPKEPPRIETLRKLDLLQEVTFEPPRTVRQRTYDDREFCGSLRKQVEAGRRLSLNQVRFLDRLLLKYAGQIPDFEAIAGELGLSAADAGPDTESEPLLGLLLGVEHWQPPAQRGRREWDDRKFYESLRRQFEQKKALSVKQRASLKKLCARYAGQIPDYEAAMNRHGLPPPARKRSARRPSADGDPAQET